MVMYVVVVDLSGAGVVDGAGLGEELFRLGGLVGCTVVGRLSRFTVRVSIDGIECTVYLNNTGRLRNLVAAGRRGFCIPSGGGRYSFRLVGIEDAGFAALIDTGLHERSFEALLSRNLIPWLESCRVIKRNARVYGTTIDYLIQCGDSRIFVEIKSAVMDLGNGFAGYPDAPTERGRRQIEALANIVREGGEGLVVFIAGTPRARGFKLLCEEDRHICSAIRKAFDAGVEFRAANIFLNPWTGGVVTGDLDLPTDLSCCIQR